MKDIKMINYKINRYIDMKKILVFFALGILINGGVLAKGKKTNPLKNAAIEYLDANVGTYDKLQKSIWADPELGFLEENSSKKLQDHLRDNGFTVESGIAGMPTAFVATFGSGYPTIGLLAEFDALPGLSQDTVPYRKPLVEGGSGHGCGHNLLGVGATSAAVALSKWLTVNNYKGTIKIFGAPAEEGGAGKVYLVRDGYFKGIDAVLDWHPSGGNGVGTNPGTAMQMIDYKFYGKSAHAAGNPWKGRSALDAVEAMDNMVNLLREHILPSSRIHYVIAEGGEAPNVVPEYARVSYYIRSPKRDVLKELTTWVRQAAEGAALGTQTQLKIELVAGTYERLQNSVLAKLVQKNLELVGGVKYDAREKELALSIVKNLALNDTILNAAERVEPLKDFPKEGSGGSSDVGDVSWAVPLATFGTATNVPGTPGHSWQNVAVVGSSIGTKGTINAAKVFSLTAIELYTNPSLLKSAKNEFDKARGVDFKYEPLLGDRKPALDYRKSK